MGINNYFITQYLVTINKIKLIVLDTVLPQLSKMILYFTEKLNFNRIWTELELEFMQELIRIELKQSQKRDESALK